MKTMILVALGGALGASLRFWVGTLLAFPLATVAVNVLGSGAIGVVWALVASRGPLAAFVVTGVLGGFTTFSAFSLDVVRLVEAGRSGAALIYLGGSVICSVAACWAGLTLVRSMGT